MARSNEAVTRSILVWAAVAAVAAIPFGFALTSPLLAWRDPIYILAGAAGVLGFALMLFQPLMVRGVLPGISALQGRMIHRWIGASLILCVVIHVAGLWITSPPDVIDALTFTSPTPFSVWGVIAMWTVFLSGALALTKRRFTPRIWRRAHSIAAAVIVVGTSVHALLIQGTMEPITKSILCLIVVFATAKTIYDLCAWTRRSRAARIPSSD